MKDPKTSNLQLKIQLFKLCQDFVESRRITIQNTIDEIQESLTYETKSSAGDKHETGRAMLQIEREKAGHQLAEIGKLTATLSKIDTTFTSKTVSLGSIVYTTQANYFIAISAGEVKVDDTKFYAISSNTPIGLLLMGKGAGDEVVFREQKFKIFDIT